MTHGYDRRPTFDHDDPDRARERPGTPGRATLTSRHVLRAPRDERGVADGADRAVDHAASGSGAALPGELRERFEASLGADLSAVRVHTGASSQAAADAVGARAYATGNDIHFAAGEYDPASSDGQFLIAHEVAHTVQQAGGVRYKLHVSQSGDAAEVEADRAAAAMVSGAPATVSAAAPAVARQPWHDPQPTPVAYDPHPGVQEMHETSMPVDDEQPIDWTGSVAATAGPEDPSPGEAAQMVAAPHVPLLPAAPGVGATKSKDVRKAEDAILAKRRTNSSALAAAHASALASWDAMAAAVDDFNVAEGDYEDGGMLGPAPKGANYDNNGGDNVAEATENQTAPGGKTTVGDLYDGGTKATGIEDQTKENAKTTEVSKALEAARVADGDVGTANRDYAGQIRAVSTATAKYNKALSKITINEEGLKEDEAKELKEKLEAQRAAAIAEVTATVATLTGMADQIIGVAADPTSLPATAGKAAVGVLMSEASGIGEQIVNNQFKAQIEQARARAQASKQTITIEKKNIANWDFVEADNELETAIEGIESKRTAVQNKLKERRDLYNVAAELAKQKAEKGGSSPEQADRIAAAIAAIPKAELVVAKLAKIASVPVPGGYSNEAGLGFAQAKAGKIAFDTSAFLRVLGMLQGYRQRFEPMKATWDARLRDLRAISMGLNVAGT
jgi:hypothetical protein